MLTALLVLAAASDSGCTRGSEGEPPLCPTYLPAAQEVTIERAGARAYATPDDRVSCATFRPTAGQVRHYLTAARTTDAQSADATLDRSSCYASGRVRFADGRWARWKIEQSRVGSLTVPGKPEMLLYCPTCRSRPFVW